MLPKVLAGPGRIYIADYGATLPTRGDIADLKAGTYTGFEFLGETTEATTITDTPNFVDLTTQQRGRTVQRYVSTWETTVETTIGDIAPERFAELCMGTVTDGLTSDEIAAAATSADATVKSLALLFPVRQADGSLAEGLLVAERIVVSSGLTYNIDRDNQSVLPWQAMVLEPSTGAAYTILLPGDSLAS